MEKVKEELVAKEHWLQETNTSYHNKTKIGMTFKRRLMSLIITTRKAYNCKQARVKTFSKGAT